MTNSESLTAQKILVTTDFSDASFAAFPYAAEEAKKREAQIDLVYIFEEPFPPMSYGDLTPWDRGVCDNLTLVVRNAQLDTARRHLQEVSKKYFGETNVNDLVLDFSGPVANAITHQARLGKYEMIVMAAQGHGFFHRAILGSVSERVLRQSPCGLLLIPPHSYGPKRLAPHLPRKKIAVTTDFSVASHAAFSAAFYEAEKNGAELVLIHVMEALFASELLSSKLNMSFDKALEVEAHYRKQIEEKLHAVAKSFDTRNISSQVISKTYSVPNAISEFVTDNEIDLLVIATRGSSEKTPWIGGVTERLARQCSSPLLVVPASR